MTDIAVPAVRPAQRARRIGLPESEAIVDLFHAACADAASAVEESGGELYLAITTQEPPTGQRDARAFADELADTVLDEDATILDVPGEDGVPDTTQTLASVRADSDAASVAVLDPRVPLIGRQHLDTAAMRLRRNDVVIGPTPTGGCYFVGTSLAADALPRVWDTDIDATTRALAETDNALGFIAILPRLAHADTISGITALVNAFNRSDQSVAPFTRACLDRYDEIGTDTS